MQMQQQADMRRIITNDFGAKPQNDNTIIYVAGGIIFLAIILLGVRKANKK